MNKIWNLIGRIAYYITLPLVSLVIRFTSRTRLIVEFDGKILVVKGWLGDNKWFLPGGGLHKDEDPKQGAIRELLEETGIKVKVSDLNEVGQGVYDEGITKYRYYLYYVRLPKMPETKRQQFEITDVGWLEPDEISPNNSSKELISLLETWK
jgi:8-oxo-dGTP pyrophosphatase MutT (NUDIX family)